MDATTSDAIIALVGTIFGGAGLEIVKRLLTKSKAKDDTATALRTELRTDLIAIKQEVDALDKEVEAWRQKYYELWEKHIRTEVELQSLRQKNSEQS